jgi:hypothetical protein
LEKKKRQKPGDFIGWKSEDGMLEVVDVHGKKGNKTTFKVICHKCKEDKELFPLDYFVSRKGHLINGNKPCGCAKKPKWTDNQYLLLLHRIAQGRFIVHGFSEEFHGQNTKANLECLVDGHKWEARTSKVINDGNGCPKCKLDHQRTDEQEALNKCKTICDAESYELLGFVDGYESALKSRIEYKCPTHGKKNVSYNDFVNGCRRCRDCWKERQKESGSLYGYYPDRKDEKDYLYILNFNDKFIKVGRSFDVDERIKGLRTKSKVPIKKIHKLRIFTATHQEIYDTEQAILEELRARGFQYRLDWTKECFENECLFILDRLLGMCDSITEI